MESKTVGTVSFHTLEPNIIRVNWAGTLDAVHVVAMRDYTHALDAELGGTPLSALIDVTEATGLAQGARQRLREYGNDDKWKRTAILGGSFQIQVVVEIIARAIELITKRETQTRFFTNEQDAIAWLHQPLPPQ